MPNELLSNTLATVHQQLSSSGQLAAIVGEGLTLSLSVSHHSDFPELYDINADLVGEGSLSDDAEDHLATVLEDALVAAISAVDEELADDFTNLNVSLNGKALV